MHRILLASALMVFQTLTAHSQSVFTEDFEEATLPEMAARWNETVNLAGMSFSSEVPPGSPGVQSLMMTAVIGENTGGHLYKMFPQGYDSLYARFYVKFSAAHNPVHHFVHMGGYNPPTRWPQGGAGERPVGNERFTTGIEPFGPRWQWDFYSYWMQMRGNPVPGMYWGNDFLPEPPAPVARGEWQCIEYMMKCNNPVSASNGEQAFWVDGKKVLHLKQGSPNGYWVWDSFHHHPDSAGFEGFQWRNDDALKLNFFWLLYYMTGGPQGQRDTVWFDDVEISESYIGPHAPVAVETIPINGMLSIDISPNPFSGALSIQHSAVESIRVYDVFGRELRSYESAELSGQSGVISWSPTGKPGMYFIRATGGGTTLVRKALYQPR